MSSSPACTDVRPQLPELALGTLTGEERARALEHLARCPACRQELVWLSDVGDELLRLAPTAQPPVGFETRALERLLGVDRSAGAFRQRWLAVAAAALMAAFLGGSAVYLAGSQRRRGGSGGPCVRLPRIAVLGFLCGARGASRRNLRHRGHG